MGALGIIPKYLVQWESIPTVLVSVQYMKALWFHRVVEMLEAEKMREGIAVLVCTSAKLSEIVFRC